MIGRILFRIKSFRFIPALFVVTISKCRSVVEYERDLWLKRNYISCSGNIGFLTLMLKFPEYRSLVYHRTGCGWLRHFGKGQTNLYFHTPSSKIGKGLLIWHGYSTVINADSIGENCSIWHNVTVGKKSVKPINDKPVIGNNCSICTGAIVIGGINIADGVLIGAGSTVVNSIEAKDAVVTGPKAKIRL